MAVFGKIKTGTMCYYKGFSVDSINTGGRYFVMPPNSFEIKSFDTIKDVKDYINDFSNSKNSKDMAKKQTIYVGKNKNGNRVVFVPTKKKSVKYTFYKSPQDGGKTHVKKTVRTVLKGSAIKNLFKGAKVEQLKRKK